MTSKAVVRNIVSGAGGEMMMNNKIKVMYETLNN